MQAKREISALWEQFEDAISEAYKEKQYDQFVGCLRDYARDQSMHHALERLLGRETAHERRHRRGAPYLPSSFPIGSAAKLLIMEAAKNGAESKRMPDATIFLVWRDSAAEAHLVGYLARAHLSQTWRDAVKALDYAKLMK